VHFRSNNKKIVMVKFLLLLSKEISPNFLDNFSTWPKISLIILNHHRRFCLCGSSFVWILDKAKPFARRTRKTTGLGIKTAELPRERRATRLFYFWSILRMVKRDPKIGKKDRIVRSLAFRR